MKIIRVLILCFSVLLLLNISANAFSFLASSGTREASADFTQSGNNLLVKLTNTYTGDANAPSDILTAVFFTLAGDPALTRVSALTDSSTTFPYYYGFPFGSNVGGEWAYVDGLSGAPYGADEGISSSGFGLFGPSNRFPGANLAGPSSPDGVQFGILPAGWVSSGDNGGLTGSGGLIKNSVLFTLSGLNYSLTADSITNISFQYGTCLDEPKIVPPPPVVPEPGTMFLLGSLAAGLFGFAGLRRRFTK